LPIDGLLDALIKSMLPGWHPNNDAEQQDHEALGQALKKKNIEAQHGKSHPKQKAKHKKS
jgi:hypothetical protein